MYTYLNIHLAVTCFTKHKQMPLEKYPLTQSKEHIATEIKNKDAEFSSYTSDAEQFRCRVNTRFT